jgi:hypothetical protein
LETQHLSYSPSPLLSKHKLKHKLKHRLKSSLKAQAPTRWQRNEDKSACRIQERIKSLQKNPALRHNSDSQTQSWYNEDVTVTTGYPRNNSQRTFTIAT